MCCGGRYQRLLKRQGHEGQDIQRSDELQVYADFLRIVLEILNCMITTNLPQNPELVYALLHQQEVFVPFKVTFPPSRAPSFSVASVLSAGSHLVHPPVNCSACLSLSKLLVPKPGSDCHPCIAVVGVYLYICARSAILHSLGMRRCLQHIH